MKSTYQRLSLDQRIVIEKSLAVGLSYLQIGQVIGCHKSSVCRDVNR